MRAAIGFGLLVTAAVVALEAGTGIPRSALNGTAMQPSSSVATAEVPREADAVRSSIYDPIPKIARTIAVAEVAASASLDPISREPFSRETRAASVPISTEQGSAGSASAGLAAAKPVPSAAAVAAVVGSGATASAIVPLAPQVAPATGGKADRMATGSAPTRPSDRADPSSDTVIAKTANKPPRAGSSDKALKAAKAGAPRKSVKAAKASQPQKAKGSARASASVRPVSKSAQRPVVVVRRGVEAQLIAVPKSFHSTSAATSR